MASFVMLLCPLLQAHIEGLRLANSTGITGKIFRKQTQSMDNGKEENFIRETPSQSDQSSGMQYPGKANLSVSKLSQQNSLQTNLPNSYLYSTFVI